MSQSRGAFVVAVTKCIGGSTGVYRAICSLIYCLSPKNCVLNTFSELSVKCAHAHAGHTHCASFSAASDGSWSAGLHPISLVLRTENRTQPAPQLTLTRYAQFKIKSQIAKISSDYIRTITYLCN